MCTRTFPLRQPPGHNPLPRLHLRFPEGLERVFTAYIGIQLHSTSLDDNKRHANLLEQPTTQIEAWLANPEFAPVSTEQFQLLGDPTTYQLSPTRDIDNSDTLPEAPPAIQSLIWVCYWTNEAEYKVSMSTLNLPKIYHTLDPAAKSHVGLWTEHFGSDTSRLETVYSATDYLPGLARLPGTYTAQHVHTGYWGAARDRIPGSAGDLFEGEALDNSTQDADLPETLSTDTKTTTKSLGKHITGTNIHNMVHIRSGQFWGNCNNEEANAYLHSLEPKLRTGLSYLWSASEESRSGGVRYLQNININPVPTPGGNPLQQTKESCVTAFFKNMTDLEKWAARHPSHLAIWAGAIKHGKKFGDKRRFRTWHEVSVLRGGEARFEYVNCVEGTGVSGGMMVLDV